MLLKTCNKCGKLIPYGISRCPDCEAKRPAEQEANARRHNRKRKADPKYKAFYRSKEWRALSRIMMSRADYRCQECGGLATEVHHTKPIQTEEGWERRLDETNLMVLCIKCHNEQHERFRRRKKTKRF